MAYTQKIRPAAAAAALVLGLLTNVMPIYAANVQQVGTSPAQGLR